MSEPETVIVLFLIPILVLLISYSIGGLHGLIDSIRKRPR